MEYFDVSFAMYSLCTNYKHESIRRGHTQQSVSQLSFSTVLQGQDSKDGHYAKEKQWNVGCSLLDIDYRYIAITTYIAITISLSIYRYRYIAIYRQRYIAIDISLSIYLYCYITISLYCYIAISIYRYITIAISLLLYRYCYIAIAICLISRRTACVIAQQCVENRYVGRIGTKRQIAFPLLRLNTV